MESKDRTRFKSLMRKMKVTFPVNLTKEEEAIRGQVYWEAFQNISIELFEMAISECIGECTFFPKPTDLWDVIKAEQRRRYDAVKREEVPEVEWRRADEEGRKMAQSFLSQIYEQIDSVNIEIQKVRDDRFEKRREELKKQAKLLVS